MVGLRRGRTPGDRGDRKALSWPACSSTEKTHLLEVPRVKELEECYSKELKLLNIVLYQILCVSQWVSLLLSELMFQHPFDKGLELSLIGKLRFLAIK